MLFSFGFFLGSPVWVFPGMPPWLAPLEVLLGGLLFWIFMLLISMPPCVYFLVWLLGFLVLDSIVHKLNPVCHELLHLWRTFVACWIVFGGNLLCLIFIPLLFLVLMPSGICIVSFLVHFTNRLLLLVPTILYRLTYCELLFLSLVGLTVCDCNRILQICGCMLIGGEAFLIVWENLYLILPDVVICPTIEDGIIYLCWIVLLCSGFWRSEWTYLHLLLYDYLGRLTDTWFLWLSLSFLKLLMPHYPLNGIFGWFHGFSNIQLILWRLISFPCHFHFSLILLGWHYNNIHPWHKCMYLLCLIWWGSVRINLSKISLPWLY